MAIFLVLKYRILNENAQIDKSIAPCKMLNKPSGLFGKMPSNVSTLVESVIKGLLFGRRHLAATASTIFCKTSW
jgi:hypothetical protein